MNIQTKALLIVACLAGSLAAQAQVPTDAPAGTTVKCSDGTYAAPDNKSGACRGHKGIQTWYGAAGGAPSKPAVAAAPAAAPAVAPAVAAAPAPAAPAPAAMAAKTPTVPATSTAATAPGGGAGKVWANDSSKVYHCMGDKYYGKTKKGEYLSEADAKSKGMHAAHNKACG